MNYIKLHFAILKKKYLLKVHIGTNYFLYLKPLIVLKNYIIYIIYISNLFFILHVISCKYYNDAPEKRNIYERYRILTTQENARYAKPPFTPRVNSRWHLRCRLNTDRKHENTLARKYFALLAPGIRGTRQHVHMVTFVNDVICEGFSG